MKKKSEEFSKKVNEQLEDFNKNQIIREEELNSYIMKKLEAAKNSSAQPSRLLNLHRSTSRWLQTNLDSLSLKLLADTQILFAVQDKDLDQTKIDYPTAFVVGLSSPYQPANLSLAFP